MGIKIPENHFVWNLEDFFINSIYPKTLLLSCGIHVLIILIILIIQISKHVCCELRSGGRYGKPINQGAKLFHLAKILTDDQPSQTFICVWVSWVFICYCAYVSLCMSGCVEGTQESVTQRFEIISNRFLQCIMNSSMTEQLVGSISGVQMKQKFLIDEVLKICLS